MDYDPTQIKPAPIQNTLLLINQFVVQTTMFLNAFSSTVETKICKVRYVLITLALHNFDRISRTHANTYFRNMRPRKLTFLYFCIFSLLFSCCPSFLCVSAQLASDRAGDLNERSRSEVELYRRNGFR